MNFAELYYNINKLRNKQNQLDQIRGHTVQFIKNHLDVKFEEFYQQLETSRKNDFIKAQLDIGLIFGLIKDLRAVTSQNNKNIDIKQLKHNILLLENKLSFLKQTISDELEALTKQELILTNELSTTESKISNFNKCPPKKSVYASKNIFVDENLCQEVKDFLNFVNKSNGHEGGWTENDHTTFMKVYDKYKDVKKVVNLVHQALPDISEEEIQTHYSWYEKYKELRCTQRQAIQKWRLNKALSKPNQDTQQDTPTDVDKVVKKTTDSRTATREKLEQWKLEKRERLKNHIDRIAEHAKRRKETQSESIVKKLQVKTELEAWKSAKMLKEQQEKRERLAQERREKEFRKAQANRLIKEFQMQDDVYVNKRRLLHRVPSVTKVKLRPSPARDPNRLLQPTSQWTARTTADEANKVQFGNTAFVNYIPKLATPQWRKTMNNR